MFIAGAGQRTMPPRPVAKTKKPIFKDSAAPRILNRRALHDYFVLEKLECGIQLVGSEVKSLRMGTAQLTEGFARIEGGELFLHGLYIDPYKLAALAYNHEPARPRKLLVHKKELRKLDDATSDRGVSMVPLALYFKDGRAKVELAVVKGKKQHDKREALKRAEVEREVRRAMSVRM